MSGLTALAYFAPFDNPKGNLKRTSISCHKIQLWMHSSYAMASCVCVRSLLTAYYMSVVCLEEIIDHYNVMFRLQSFS